MSPDRASTKERDTRKFLCMCECARQVCEYVFGVRDHCIYIQGVTGWIFP